MATLSPKYAVRKRLADDTTIQGYVTSGGETRIYEQSAPQGKALPYILFEGMDGEHVRYLGGTTNVAYRDIDISAVSTDAKQAEDIAEAVRLRMKDYAGTVTIGSDSVTIEDVSKQGEEDDFIDPIDANDVGKYMRTITYRVWFRAATS